MRPIYRKQTSKKARENLKTEKRVFIYEGALGRQVE